jgi:plasmid stabilization system protein ParE
VKLRIVLTPNAQAELAERNRWWRKNRPANPGLLKQEIKEALTRVAERPESGPSAEEAGAGVRKVLLPRTQHYAYYRINRAERTLRVLSIWHTARAQPPRL